MSDIEPGVILGPGENAAVAWRMAAHHLEHDEWWDWEDIPNLDESCLEATQGLMHAVARHVRRMADDYDTVAGVDSKDLLARLTA